MLRYPTLIYFSDLILLYEIKNVFVSWETKYRSLHVNLSYTHFSSYQFLKIDFGMIDHTKDEKKYQKYRIYYTMKKKA